MLRPIFSAGVLFALSAVLSPARLSAQGSPAARPPSGSGPAVSVMPKQGPALPVTPKSGTALPGTALPGTTLPGTTRTGPLLLAVGSWTGQLSTPGRMLSIGLTIGKQGSSYTATLDIPGGTVRARRLGVNQRADTLRLLESTLDARFTCSVSPDGQALSVFCTWPQLGVGQTRPFHRGIPQEAAPTSGRNSVVKGRTAYETKWEKGPLENGEPVGAWDYYQKDDAGDYVLTHSYDYTARKLTFVRAESKPFETEVRPGVWETTLLNQAPWFIGRHDALAALGRQLTYPPEARRLRLQGRVWVTFAVDTLGRVSDPRILRGLGSGCDEESLRVARTIPDNWTPGRLGTRAVACRSTLIFVFEL